MSNLKVFVDLMSQPSRAVALFVKLNKIPHQLVLVTIKKGEHLEPDYVSNVNRFGKVPAILDGDYNVIESISILKYLSRKHKVPDHWYPEDIRQQAKVDEFLEWHHIGLRVPLSMFFQTKLIIPIMTGQPSKESHVQLWRSRMEVALDHIENIWLKKTPYLTGDKITIADLIGLCEIDQPRMAAYDPAVGRPRLAAWLQRVRNDTQPHYNEVTKILEMVIKKFGGEPPSSLSKL